jgi:polyhydroxybutyrate depolymerase
MDRHLLERGPVYRLPVFVFGLAACRPAFLPECDSLDLGPGAHASCKMPGHLDRGYDLQVPASWDGVSPLPLVIAYHGGGGNRVAAQRVTCAGGDLGGDNCLVEMANARGYAVVSPDGIGSRPLRDVRTWNAGGGTVPGRYCASGQACARGIDDIGYTDDLLAEVGAAIAIDANRIYATGLSNGGAMSHRLACERPAVMAAVAPVGGANQHADDGGACSASVPVLHIHGTLDPAWPFDGGVSGILENKGEKTSVEQTMTSWALRNGCGATFVDAAVPDVDSGDGVVSTRRTWDGCAAATELIIMEGAGHTWPSGFQYFGVDTIGAMTQDFGNEVILDFFDAHPRP